QRARRPEEVAHRVPGAGQRAAEGRPVRRAGDSRGDRPDPLPRAGVRGRAHPRGAGRRDPRHHRHSGDGDAVGDSAGSRPLRRGRAAQSSRPAGLGFRPEGGRRRTGRRQGDLSLMAIFLLFGAVFALVLLNVPIAIALGFVALVAILSVGGLGALANVPLVMYTGSTSFPLIAIPLFILAGAIMNASGISRRLIALSSAIFGFARGALAQVTVVTSLFFAEISGSAVADAAALGTILIPAMKAKGYTKEFSAAVLSSASTLAVIIPPSIPMIL